jgi:hypothetical protein
MVGHLSLAMLGIHRPEGRQRQESALARGEEAIPVREFVSRF